MNKPSSQERYVRNKSDASSSSKMVRSKVTLELHLLPVDVLRDIFSRLSLKQAVRMSALSREWWRLGLCHPDLVFTKDTLFGSNKIIYYIDRESTTAEFITRVDNLLRPFWSSPTTTTTVDKFVVKFGLTRHHMHHIDRWINFSTESMAKHISLDLIGWSVHEDDKYVVPLCKLSGSNGSCVKSLHMANVCVKLAPSFSGITNLKKLSLHMVSIDADDLQCLLLSCALLESLRLEDSPLSSFSIRQELCRLQHLSVRECPVGTIQLRAPNLTTFQFDDFPTQIVLIESSKLLEATFVFKNIRYNWCEDALDYVLAELPAALPYVHKLFVHVLVEDEEQKFSKTHTAFLYLRYLNLNIDIIDTPEDTSWVTRFVNLLDLAPLLEELELHISSSKSDEVPATVRILTDLPGPLHRHLKSVHITGFCDLVGIVELVLYILRNCTVLEHMVVDPVIWMYCGYPYTGQFYSVSKANSSQEFARPSFTEEELRPAREFARKHLDKVEFRHILTIL
ncbi:hypothetical protein VPH35_033130 [Triticum aestivum]